MKLFLSLLLCLTPVLSVASDKGNGGDSVAMTDGHRRLLDLVEHAGLDYFDFKTSQFEDGKTTGGFGFAMDDVRQYIGPSPLSPLNESISGCLDGYSKADGLFPVKQLRWAMTDAVLPEILDEGMISVQSPISKRQLAIQSDGLVLINRADFNSLDNVSKIALKLHEGTICAIRAVNPYLIPKYGTSLIRNFVRAYIDVKLNGKPRYVLLDAVKSLNVPSAYNSDVAITSGVKGTYSEIKVLVPYLSSSRSVTLTEYIAGGMEQVVNVDTLDVARAPLQKGSASLARQIVRNNQEMLKEALSKFTFAGIRARQATGGDVSSDGTH